MTPHGRSCGPQIGRVDATAADPEGRLPMENFGSEQLKEAFRSQGMGVKELVALAGAHTIGGKGFGDPTGFDNDYYKALLKRPWEQPG